MTPEQQLEMANNWAIHSGEEQNYNARRALRLANHFAAECKRKDAEIAGYRYTINEIKSAAILAFQMGIVARCEQALNTTEANNEHI